MFRIFRGFRSIWCSRWTCGRITILIVACCCWLVAAKHQDFRIVTHEELGKVERFQQHDVGYFSELLFDIARYQLLVGSRDYLFRLSLEGLQKLEEVYIPATVDTIDTCKLKGQSDEMCRNFIRVIVSHEGKVFVCGTNAFSPECSWRDINALTLPIEWVPGIGKCPYSPLYNSTALMTVDGDYYVATPLDFHARDFAIYRIMGKEPFLRTVQYNPKWLNEPNFVGSFENDNFIYFFFRETAVEYINCGKVIYSRVARMCKNDKGGQYILKDNWTTFLKARLNCSMPGEYPFYYNEIQSIHFLVREQIVFATFTTSDNSIFGSAICAFSMNSMNQVFQGPFKYQQNPTSTWQRKSASNKHFQCATAATPSEVLDSEKYQLLDDAVQPINQFPLYKSELERLSHIVVDVVPTKHHDGVHVIFASTIESIIKKLVVVPRIHQTCLIEEIRLFPENRRKQILSLKLLKDTSSLYIGTEEEVLRIPLHRCERFKSKQACLNSMDPYCGWNEYQLSCTTAPGRNPLHNSWIQEVTSCPRTDLPVDGEWGPWSSWFECVQASSKGDRCQCRQRACDNPPPSNGGKSCTGNAIEVTNCTQNGQWTEWSAWSACSHSCGLAVKTRHRTCGNPAPAFGGRVCIGLEREEIYCTANPPCPVSALPPVDGHWSEWGAWEECSAPCGGGIQIRRRRCNNPLPQNGGRECVGCGLEHRECHTHQCPEARKSTPWTPWLRSNVTKEGYFEQKFRFSCRANVPDPGMIRIGQMKKEERFCLEGGQNCLDTAFLSIDGEWSEWSGWSECSVKCGSGIQYRERKCDNPRPSGSGADCQGISRLERECNSQPCQTYWSCWSEFSACSVTCGQGKRVRTRQCLIEDAVLTNGSGGGRGGSGGGFSGGGNTAQHHSALCKGAAVEEYPCEMPSCYSLEGWQEWSVWSLCDHNQEQHRKRSCLLQDPSRCVGLSKETRICIPLQHGVSVAENKAMGSDGYSLATVLGALFGGFFAGSILGGVAACWFMKRKMASQRSPQQVLTQLVPAKPNPYVSESEWKSTFDPSMSPGKTPLREATIKRNGHFRAQIHEDQNF